MPWRYVDALWLNLPAFLARLALNALSAGMDISPQLLVPTDGPDYSGSPLQEAGGFGLRDLAHADRYTNELERSVEIRLHFTYYVCIRRSHG